MLQILEHTILKISGDPLKGSYDKYIPLRNITEISYRIGGDGVEISILTNIVEDKIGDTCRYTIVFSFNQKDEANNWLDTLLFWWGKSCSSR
jgi:hypothetical protein